MAHFLGIDIATQSLTGVVIDSDTCERVLVVSVRYQELQRFPSRGYLYADDSLEQHADPLMWIEALEEMLRRGKEDQGYDWSQVAGVACSGQQHGTVYLNAGCCAARWDAGRSLVDQVQPLLSRKTAPIWMDSSTSTECDEIAAATPGGRLGVSSISGSCPIERFSGPQIRKFAKTAPAAYEATARVHLVSSFFAYLLTESDAAIDLGDGAGMNLLDLSTGRWSDVLLQATAPGLAQRLPEARPCDTVAGLVAPFFQTRYGFGAKVPVLVSTGDNPSSLIGMGASDPGQVIISLGTSDTLFAALSKPLTDPAGFGHVFGNPAGGFMSLICFKNGSLAREHVAKRFNLSWSDFSAAIEDSQPGNGGNVMLPFLFPEITPRVTTAGIELFGSEAFVGWRDPVAAARAVVEAQAVSMRVHSRWIGESSSSILVTGGASENDGILQVFADVFQAPLQRLSISDSAAQGAAIRIAQKITGQSWSTFYSNLSKPAGDTIRPRPAAAEAYVRLEQEFLKRLSSRA